MKSILILLLSALWVGQVAIAAPAYPLEGLLPRAETVFIGNVSREYDKNIIFTVTERLRGENKNELTFEFVGDSANVRLEPNSRYFIISQGDNHFGKPKPIITLGQSLKGQAGYCGWIMFAVKTEGEQTYLERISSSPSNGRVTLKHAKKAVEQVPYNPDIYGKRKTQTAVEKALSPSAYSLIKWQIWLSLTQRQLLELATSSI